MPLRAGAAFARALLVASAMALVASPHAVAATAYVSADYGGDFLFFQSDPAEANDLTITESDGEFTLTDRGADIVAGEGCSGGGATVTCDGSSVVQVQVDLRDGDDVLFLEVPVSTLAAGGEGNDDLTGSDASRDPFTFEDVGDDLSGGPGDDRLTGRAGFDFLGGGLGSDAIDGGADQDSVLGGEGAETEDGPDRLTGGPDADVLSGEAGDDILDGGEGEDILLAGAGDDQAQGGPGNDLLVWDEGADDLRGGGEVDVVAYSALFTDTMPQQPVRVTIDGVADDGPSGDNDNVAVDIEDVVTDEYYDYVTGNASGNLLDTAGGPDQVDGLGGPDSIFAGSGDDAVESRDGVADRISCGEGNDSLAADAEDDVHGDCEDVHRTSSGGGSSQDPSSPQNPSSPGPSTAPPAGQPPVDREPPRLTISAQRAVRRRELLRRGLALTVRCDERSALLVTLIAQVRGARLSREGDLVVAERVLPVGDCDRSLRLRVPRRLGRALHPRTRLRLVAQAIDPSGNVGSARRSVLAR